MPRSGNSPEEGIGYPLQYSWASLVTELVKNPPAMWEPGFDPWVGKIPWRRESLLTPVFWPGEFHGLYSPWGRKETQLSDFHFTHHKKTNLSNILNFFFNKSFKDYYNRKLNIHFIRC